MDATILAQFGIGGDNIWSFALWMGMMMVFFLFYPRIMISQIMWKLEKSAIQLEDMSRKNKKFLLGEISKKPTKETKDSLNMFFEFFVIGPVSLDPFGVIRKLEHVIQDQKERFRMFVRGAAPHKSKEHQANLEMGLAAGLSLYEISKIVRHYVELVKKTKSLQIAMILQMQLPMIERIARALYKGTNALAKGLPIGDSIGPMVATELIGNRKVKEIEEDIIMAEIPLKGKRKAYVLKAKGPGGRLGRPGKAVQKLAKKNIARVITIDAAAKLEGEKTGSIAEGVGVAMGGVGVEKSFIEGMTVDKRISVDSIIVKMSQEEAITPMRKAIKDAIPGVMKALDRCVERTKPGSRLIIVGVGNTSGIGNRIKDNVKTAAWVEAHERKLKREKLKKKKKRFFLF